MEKLPAKKKLAVIRNYFSGLSNDENSAKTGVSKGAISGIITELKNGGFPEVADLADQIEILRELSLELKHSGQAPGQCAVGLAALKRIFECGLEVADINRWSDILKMVGDDDTVKGFIDMVYRIQDALEENDLTIGEIDSKFQELQNKAAELQPTLDKVAEEKKEIVELEKKRDILTPVVESLEHKYAVLNPIVSDLQKRQSTLMKQIKKEEAITASSQAGLTEWSKEKQKLKKAGFTIESLVAFNDKLRVIAARHHIKMSPLRERLLHELEVLNKGLGLESLVKAVRATLKKQQEALTSTKNRSEELKETIGTLTEQKAALEASFTVTKEKISLEIEQVIPITFAMLNKFNEQLQRGGDEILGTVTHIKDQAYDIGTEMGRYEGIVEANDWLIDLLAMMKGDDKLEAAKVRAILLPIIRGSQPWMKSNKEKVGMTSPIPQALALLVEGLEQWQE